MAKASRAEDTLLRATAHGEEGMVLSFTGRGYIDPGWAPPSCWRKRILSFMYKMVRGKNCFSRGPGPSGSPSSLKEGQDWTAGYWDAQTGVKLELGTWAERARRPGFHTGHLDPTHVSLCVPHGP